MRKRHGPWRPATRSSTQSMGQPVWENYCELVHIFFFFVMQDGAALELRGKAERMAPSSKDDMQTTQHVILVLLMPVDMVQIGMQALSLANTIMLLLPMSGRYQYSSTMAIWRVANHFVFASRCGLYIFARSPNRLYCSSILVRMPQYCRHCEREHKKEAAPEMAGSPSPHGRNISISFMRAKF